MASTSRVQSFAESWTLLVAAATTKFTAQVLTGPRLVFQFSDSDPGVGVEWGHTLLRGQAMTRDHGDGNLWVRGAGWVSVNQ